MDQLLEMFIVNRFCRREASTDEDHSTSDEEDSLPLPKRPKIMNYASNVVALYSDDDFKSHFRLKRSTFEYLLLNIIDDLKRHVKGHEMVEPKIQLMIALWKMATPESYRSVSDRFNVGKATAHRCIHRVVNALNKRIAQFIKWPTVDDCANIMHNFEMRSSFPKVIGAIDGTHFEIETPKENGQDYINRKKYASIQMQAICDHKYLFTHIYVGHPGSVHDMRVFRQSPIPNHFGNSEKFPNNSHLVGDSAYALHQNIMVPFKDNGRLNASQKRYNICLSSARVVIEQTFGLLKYRWRSLLNCIPVHNVKDMPKFIAACCILHNICILERDLVEIEETGPEPVDSQLGTNNEGDFNVDREAAIQKRNEIVSLLL